MATLPSASQSSTKIEGSGRASQSSTKIEGSGGVDILKAVTSKGDAAGLALSNHAAFMERLENPLVSSSGVRGEGVPGYEGIRVDYEVISAGVRGY